MLVSARLAAYSLALSSLCFGQGSPEVAEEVLVLLGDLPADLSLSPAKKFKAKDRLPLHVRWSSDGTLAAYVGFRGEEGEDRVPVFHRAGEEVVVGEVYDFIDSPMVARDAPKVAFRVGNTRSKTKERWWVWLDGEPDHQEDWIGAVGLSPDGSRVAYWAQPGAELEKGGAYVQKPMVLRAPGKKKVRKPKKWDDARALQAPVFTADSEKVFGLGMEDGRWYAVGTGRKSFEALGHGALMASDLCVAKGGKSIAFHGLVEEHIKGVIQQSRRVVKGEDIVPTSHVRTGYPALSTDGKRVAQKYMSFNMTMGIVIDEGKGREPGFDYVGRPAWDPKGKRVAFASVTEAGGVESEALSGRGELEPREGEWRLTQWTVKGKAFTSRDHWERVRDPRFDSEGDVVAVRVLDEKGWRLVVLDLDGKVILMGPAHEEVGPPQFSDDGDSVSYGVRDQGRLSWGTLMLP